MARHASNHPTDREMDILNVLWSKGPATVREIHDELNRRLPTDNPIAYTTVLSMLQLMRGKGLVACDDSERSHVYRARRDQKKTKTRVIAHLMNKLNDSLVEFVAQTLVAKKPSAKDLQQIREIIDRLERGEKGEP